MVRTAACHAAYGGSIPLGTASIRSMTLQVRRVGCQPIETRFDSGMGRQAKCLDRITFHL